MQVLLLAIAGWVETGTMLQWTRRYLETRRFVSPGFLLAYRQITGTEFADLFHFYHREGKQLGPWVDG